MTGAQILALTGNLLGGENIDQTFGLQMLNVIRAYVEMRRPWQVLKKKDTSVTITGANTYTNPLTMPSDFRMYLGDGTIQLFDGANNLQYCTEVPYEEILDYRLDSFKFAADYGAKQFYITGIVPSTFTVYQWYIANYGDITASTTWLRFPDEYHPLLAYELAAMWRLGTDYDDVNARNADDNAKRADMMYQAMSKWDARLALSAVKNLEYPQNVQGKGAGEAYGPRGTLRTPKM
jgi:hypothetical protein